MNLEKRFVLETPGNAIKTIRKEFVSLSPLTVWRQPATRNSQLDNSNLINARIQIEDRASFTNRHYPN